MSELAITARLIRLICMTLSNTASSIYASQAKIKSLRIVENMRGLRQGDSLSCTLFNFMLDGSLSMLEYNVLAFFTKVSFCR